MLPRLYHRQGIPVTSSPLRNSTLSLEIFVFLVVHSTTYLKLLRSPYPKHQLHTFSLLWDGQSRCPLILSASVHHRSWTHCGARLYAAPLRRFRQPTSSSAPPLFAPLGTVRQDRANSRHPREYLRLSVARSPPRFLFFSLSQCTGIKRNRYVSAFLSELHKSKC